MATLPKSCWPSGAVVDALASKAAQLTAKGIAKPVVMADLRDWLPFWATEDKDEASEGMALCALSSVWGVLCAKLCASR